MTAKLLSDAAWHAVKSILPPPNTLGRHRASDRKILNGILYVLSSGITWVNVPRNPCFVSPATTHRRFIEWQTTGVWNQIRTVLTEHLDPNLTIDWVRAEQVSGNRKTRPKTD